MASLAPLTVASLATTGNLNVTGTASTGLLTAAGLNNTGNLAITGTSTLTGLATVSTGINVLGNKVINFGSDQAKATNAGSIGYQSETPGALDVYGGGPTVGSRNVKIWDSVVVPNAVTSNTITTSRVTFPAGNNVLTGTNIQCGNVNSVQGSLETVTFARPFLTVPIVTITSTFQGPQTNFLLVPYVNSVSTSGFTMYANYFSTGSPSINGSNNPYCWIAVSPSG